MKVSIFTVAGSPPIVGHIVTDEGDCISVEHPIIFHKEDSNIFTFPYMPLAKRGIVNFSKASIIAMASVDEDVESYYVELVNGMKQKKTEVPDKVLEKKLKESEIIYNKSKYLN